MSSQYSLDIPAVTLTGNLTASINDGADPYPPGEIVDPNLPSGSNRPEVEVELKFQSSWPGLAAFLTGPFDVTVYWEGMGNLPEGEQSQTMTGNFVNGELVAKQTIKLDSMTGDSGLYRMSVAVQINQNVPGYGNIHEIAGFIDLGMIQLADT